MIWWEMLAYLCFLPAMAGYPACCLCQGRPPAPPGPPTGWPPTVYCTDHCTECTVDTDDCGSQDVEACPKCVTIALTFSSDADPINCPCDTTKTLEACYYSNIEDDATRSCGYQSGFQLDSGLSCATEEWRAAFYWSGLDLTLSLWNGASAFKATKTIAAWDCTSITYDFAATLPIAITGVPGLDFCTWTGGTVSFGTCA